MRVKVYRNLRGECLSIQYKGKVIDHCDYAVLSDVVFWASQAGRERVLRDRQKNVHAFIVGQWHKHLEVGRHQLTGWDTLKYNPYKKGYFYKADTEQRVLFAEQVVVYADGTIKAFNAEYGE